MAVYHAPLADMRFVLNDLLQVDRLAALPGYEEATPDIFDAILEEGAKFCENELFPLNLSGDSEGCHYENGVVRTPAGFREAYQAFVAGGWAALTADPKWGGQGLPHVLGIAVEEMICSANMAFGMYPGLTHGAVSALSRHAAPALQDAYLPKLSSGEWSGTMCLTEPQCGTDLGLLRTRAEPDGAGAYRITGTKIFISAGEHDLTSNIVHLVLARLPDAPDGIKGVSLFLAPKFLPQADGAPGRRNGVRCGSIEHKMGIKANATALLNFDEATGWLIGQPHKGLRCMFTMMNAARLGVGIQGLGVAETAHQSAAAYAQERRQSRSPDRAKQDDERPADPIIAQPDVRRMLLAQRATSEAARALAYWVGLALDFAEKHPDPAVRQEADDLVALMTPIIKACLTDHGSEAANLAIQVYGGHGYIHDHGVEQLVRDARIAQIYEGTNGVQALDLVGRKLSQNMGRLLRRFFHPVSRFVDQNIADPKLGEFVLPLAKAFAKLQQATAHLAQLGLSDQEEAAAAATDYLKLFGLVALAFMWARMVEAACAKLDGAGAGAGKPATDPEFYRAKIATARFFMMRELPRHATHFAAIMAGKATLMELPAAAF